MHTLRLAIASLTIPRTTPAQLASSLQKHLDIQTLRVEGDPNLPITHVALFPGLRVDQILANQPLWNPEHPPAPARP